MRTTSHKLVLGLIILLGICLRTWVLPQQGIFYGDEGAMVYRAGLFKALIEYPGENPQQPFSHVDTKILWIVLNVLAQCLITDPVLAVQILSCVFGLLTVWLTYLFVLKFTWSRHKALLAAFFLSVSPYHLFYSRLALPETASAFLFLLSLYVYPMEDKRGYRKASSMFAGFVFGLAFLANRFRTALLPVFLVVFGFRHHRSGGKKFDPLSFLIFLASAAATVFFLVVSLYGVLDHLGVHIPPYFHGMKKHLALHAPGLGGAVSVFSYLYFIYQIDGVVFLFLFLAAFYYCRRDRVLGTSLLIVVIQMAFSLVVDEKGPRSLSPVLPFLAIIYAGTLFEIFQSFRKTGLFRVVWAVIIFLLAATVAVQTFPVTQYRSDMKKAVRYMHERDPEAGVLTSNSLVHFVYSPHSRFRQLLNEDRDDAVRLKKAGFRYLLLDPVHYSVNVPTERRRGMAVTPFVRSVQTDCRPVKTFDNYSVHLQKRYWLEGNRDLARTIFFLQDVNEETGWIRIYDLQSCLPKLTPKD